MYHRIQAYFAGVKPVWVNGTLYVLLALFGAMELTFNSDEVYKYFPYPHYVWTIKQLLAWSVAIVTALKMFMDKSFADHEKEKELKAAGLKPAPPQPPVLDKNSLVNQPEQTAQQTTETATVENKL